ncbi:oleate hydratase, partial [Staphylococcus aureus]|nr:oleate hydratase [Staphylococcus aureus]
SWTLWKNLARQSPEFGNPDKFFQNIPEKSLFVSATSTTNNKEIIDTIESICKLDPLAGKTVTGGIITINDSAWQMS